MGWKPGYPHLIQMEKLGYRQKSQSFETLDLLPFPPREKMTGIWQNNENVVIYHLSFSSYCAKMFYDCGSVH